MKFRARQTEIEATQWFPALGRDVPGVQIPRCGADWFHITTIEGQAAFLQSGDWVVKESGTDYYYYICKPDIFEKLFEPIPDVAEAGREGKP